MNVVASLTLGVGFVALAVVLNQIHARIALLEVTLNEGLPPGHERVPSSNDSMIAPTDRSELLGPGLHLFLSRNCVACQRLVSELRDRPLRVPVDVTMHYVDRPRPIARSVAETLAAVLHEGEHELASACGADPLPYAVAVGPADLVAGAVTPTAADVRATARQAGIQVL